MKLLLLDKDGTLVKPKSGNTFVQHPEGRDCKLVCVKGSEMRSNELLNPKTLVL